MRIFSLLISLIALALPSTLLAQDFRMQMITDGLSHPWGLAPITSNDFLITQKTGGIIRITEGKKTLLEGGPEAYIRGQGGVLDIALDPNFTKNQWVYISYSEGTKKDNGLSIARFTLTDDALIEPVEIFRQSSRRSTPAHYGGRIAFSDDATLFVSTGDAYNNREDAQKPDSQLGKIIRIDTNTLKAEIYSIGHRNPQGLVFDASSNILYSHEHGPKGGDEVNVITKGANYGWPLATFGVDYSGAQISPFTEFEGTVQPNVNWTPSIAPSGMALYQGEQFAQLNNHLIVGSLKFKQIHIVDVSDPSKTTFDTRVLTPNIDERVRDVRVLDGRIFIVTDSKDGKLIELTPTS